MREPYRVAVWGTGTLAGGLIRMLDRLDSLELVGVRSWAEQKKGRDVGEVLGMTNLAIPVSIDPEEVIALRPEVVLHAARDECSGNLDDEIIRLLESGINVITAAAYRKFFTRSHLLEEPPWCATPDNVERFRAAAYTGGSTFYNSGLNPDFMIERLNLTLSGLCSEVDHIYQKEIFRCDAVGEQMFEVCGFGLPMEESVERHQSLGVFAYYFEPCIRIVAERMGRPLDRIERSDSYSPIEHDFELPAVGGNLTPRTIKAGCAGVCSLKIEGYHRDHRFITIDSCYYLGEDLRPPDAIADDCYLIEIEGRPSLKAAVALFASAKDGTYRYDESDPIQPGYYSTAGPMIQAVPFVVDAPPGLMDSLGPPIHYRADLRHPRPWSPVTFTGH